MATNPIPSPLPADLPTNWVRGQTIAPAGTDVGLTKQYGYNYLMAAVNAAQSGVNTIGEAFSELATTEQIDNIISQLPSFAKVETGNYTGTGTYGQDNANTISVPGTAVFIIIQSPFPVPGASAPNSGNEVYFAANGSKSSIYAVIPAGQCYVSNGSNNGTITFSMNSAGTKVRFYTVTGSSADLQYNKSNVTYKYIIFYI